MTYVLAGSLGAVGMVPDNEEVPTAPDLVDEEINPSDAEAPGEHIVRAFEQARTIMLQ